MKLSNNSSRSDKYYKNTFSPLRLMATSTSYLAQKVCLKVVETLVLMIWLRKRCVTCLRFWASLSSMELFWCRSCFKSWKTLVFTTTAKIRWASNNSSSSSSTIRTKSLLRGVHLSRIQKLQNRRRARSKKNNLTCLGSIRNQSKLWLCWCCSFWKTILPLLSFSKMSYTSKMSSQRLSSRR